MLKSFTVVLAAFLSISSVSLALPAPRNGEGDDGPSVMPAVAGISGASTGAQYVAASSGELQPYLVPKYNSPIALAQGGIARAVSVPMAYDGVFAGPGGAAAVNYP